MYTNVKSAALALALAAVANAQTHSLCNPVKGDKCPPNPAFGSKADLDFAKLSSVSDLEKFFDVDGGIKYDTKYEQLTFPGEGGMEMSIHEERHAPLLISNNYLFFGHVEVELRAAPGAGIITSIVLQSDSLDEIDWEFVGNDQNHVQTNLFKDGKEDYTQGAFHELSFNAMESFHKYAFDWTPEKITFSIDGNVVREQLPSSGVFPQTPCQLRIGTWVGGKGGEEQQGTIDWAGGMADWSKAPFNAYYRRLEIVDYAGGYEGATKYEFTNDKGTWESIKVTGGKEVGFPNSDFPPTNNNEIDESSSSSASSIASSVSSVFSSVESSLSASSASSTAEASSSIEESSSAIETSSVESSSVATETETSTTTSPTGSPTASPTSDGAEGDDEDEDDNGSGASTLQKGGLFAGLALTAFALLM